MAKSDKVTVESRVHDVLRLMLAGAEFADIQQFASKQGWDVGERQIRRYIEFANQRFAETTESDRQQLLGRHLMQRRALYARAVKANDLRTALQVLRDEASLEGLYPPTKIAPTTPDGRFPYHSVFTGVPRRDRVRKLLTAEAKDDGVEIRLVQQASPSRTYRLPDTTLPIMLLHILAMTYVIEQLEAMAMVTNAMFCSTLDDPDGSWDDIGKCAAFTFRVRRDGWQLFTDELGGVGDCLVSGNYHGQMLELYGDKVCDIAPTEQEVIESLARLGVEDADLATADDRCAAWRASIAPMYS